MDRRTFTFALAAAGVGHTLTGCDSTDIYVPPVAPADISTSPSRVAITIDDLPYVPVSQTKPREGLRFARQITAALAKHQITATGFAVGGQVKPQSEPALRAFAEAGHTIGNHSWSHPDYTTLTPKQFRSETERTDAALAPWIGDGPKYYRFPFLRQGATAQAQASANLILSELGYRNVPVTIDNDEWQYNADYLEAIRRLDVSAAQAIATEYIAHMQERTAYFQRLATRRLGGDVDHILLIHLNRINADHLGTLLGWYAAENWEFVTVGQALEHSFYTKPDRYFGPRGLSQIERVLGGA